MFPQFLNAERLTFLMSRKDVIKNGPRDVNGGEQVGQQTDGQGYRKAADGTRSESEKNCGRRHRGHVSVYDGLECVREAARNGGAHGLAGANFFSNTLKDQDV